MSTIVIHIFQNLIPSTLLSDVYDLMRRILCLNFIVPNCNVIVPLVQHYLIKNILLNGVSYLYAITSNKPM